MLKKVNSLSGQQLTVQAIIQAHNRHSYLKIVDNIKAIIFLGTPHRGIDLKGILTNVFASPVPRRFIDELHSSSDMIQEINDTFPSRSLAIELISYWESTEMRGVGVPCMMKF